MDGHQKIRNTDKTLVKQSLVHSAQQANETKLTRLQHMNEDCLLEIFSSKSLTPIDLCALAETCTRFEQITQRVFPKEFHIAVDYEKEFQFKSKNYSGSDKSAHDVERIFKNFGSCLSALSFRPGCRRYNKESDFVFDLLTKYCVGSLETLTIRRMEIPEVLAVKLKPIFQQLQKLDLNCVTIECGNNLFANCVSLTELEVADTKNVEAVLKNIFPKLERFGFWCFKDEKLSKFDYEYFLSVFISRHKSLKNLSLEVSPYAGLTGRFLQTIGNNCKKLEELTIRMTPANKNDVSPLHALDQLKRLTIRLGYTNATEYILQLQALKSLEILKIEDGYGFDIDKEFIPALALLTNLRELHLMEACDGLTNNFHQLSSMTQLTKLYLYTYGPAIINVVDIIRRLANLEELTIYDRGFVLCEKSFFEIVEIVKGRPHVLTLKCKFNFFFNSKNCDENRNVKLIKI